MMFLSALFLYWIRRVFLCQIKYGFFALFIFASTELKSQENQSFSVSNDNSGVYIGIKNAKEIIKIDSLWKYHSGDNPIWSSVEFDDSNWKSISNSLNLNEITAKDFPGIGWFRNHFKTDSSITTKLLALVLHQKGASEIYLDGKLIHQTGTVSIDPLKERRYNPHENPVSIKIDGIGNHVLAVRYSNHKAFSKYNVYDEQGRQGFTLQIMDMDEALKYNLKIKIIAYAVLMFLAGSLLSFGFFHFILFSFYNRDKPNMYYSVFSLSFGLMCLAGFLCITISNQDIINHLDIFISFVTPFAFISLQGLVYSLFNKSKPKIFRLELISSIVAICIFFFSAKVGDIISAIVCFIALFDALRVVLVNSLKRLKNYRHSKRIGKLILIIFGIIVSLSILGFFVNIFSSFKSTPIIIVIIGAITIIVLILLSLISVPLIMLIRHARSFSTTNKNLEQQLDQVKVLSAKTLEQEREKKQIIEGQKEVLEIQVAERTAELSQKNKDITDSINYAKRIQEAILPSTELVYKTFKNAFILYRPKDVVSGDFYAFAEKNNKVIIAAADCTGHGVPGAFMSMIGHNLLNQIIIEKEITQPGEILNNLHEGVRNALKQHESGAETRDGMDIALCSIDLKQEELEYAGAQRPLYIIKNNRLEEIPGDKHSIGGLQTEEKRSFSNHKIKLEKESTLYIFTDGFADQFGGPDGKKLMVKKLKELLLSIQEKGMKEQENYLAEYFEKWKGKNEQVDDVLVIGIRI